MKENDFSEVQERAIDLQTKSRGLVSNVTELISPASKFNSRVEDTGKSIEELTSRLDDLKNKTEVAAQKKATAYGLTSWFCVCKSISHQHVLALSTHWRLPGSPPRRQGLDDQRH